MREFAVVGEDEESGCLSIEAPDVEQPLLELLDEPRQVGATSLISQRRHDADRLVEHEISAARVELDRDAID